LAGSRHVVDDWGTELVSDSEATAAMTKKDEGVYADAGIDAREMMTPVATAAHTNSVLQDQISQYNLAAEADRQEVARRLEMTVGRELSKLVDEIATESDVRQALGLAQRKRVKQVTPPKGKQFAAKPAVQKAQDLAERQGLPRADIKAVWPILYDMAANVSAARDAHPEKTHPMLVGVKNRDIIYFTDREHRLTRRAVRDFLNRPAKA
jgi:hypothetical protein